MSAAQPVGRAREIVTASSLPGIRASQVREIVNHREHLLLWVHSGTARIELDGVAHEVAGGEALLVPSDMRHSVEVADDSLAFPILLPAHGGDRAPSAPVAVAVPESWADWLVWRFAANLGYLRGIDEERSSLFEIVAGSRPARGESVADPLSPPLPRSPEAREIAQTLLRNPANGHTLDEFASRVSSSPRTVQRQFRGETGLAFAEWRARARIAAAVSHLSAGRSIAWTEHAVGYRTAAGFTRAFRRELGISPSDFRRNLPRRKGPVLGEAEAVLHAAALPETPPPIPAMSTWDRINDFHVGVWMYRGSATVRLGDEQLRLEQGDALWLPAGVRNAIDIAEGSLLLPIASRAAEGLEQTGGDARIVRFSGDAERTLLHMCVANNTLLRPRGHDDIALVERLRRRPLAEVGPDPSANGEHVRRLTAALHRNPADSRSLEQWAHALGAEPRALARDFTAATGERFVQWRGRLRMSLAREMLDWGEAPSTVARRLGYAHLSGFSRLFAETFGASPRAYQRATRLREE